MPPVIRPATPQDLFSIVALLTQDAQERSALDPPLWIIAVDAPARIEKAVGAGLRQPQASARELWFVADRNIAVDKLFTHRWRLDQAEEAYRVFDTQTSGKGVIVPS